MNIIERGQQFVESMQELANRTVWDWKRCPGCGNTQTCKWGSYERHPWFLEGRRSIRVQRHRCNECRKTYSERSPLLVRGSWYAREAHRFAIDHWLHMGSSLRRTAEMMRSWMGKQERWHLWRPLDEARGERCYLGASTIHRWLDTAGRVAEKSVEGQLEGIASSEQVGTDGLWARLRGGVTRVVLILVDSASGLIWPPVVAAGEKSRKSWESLFERAKKAGLDLHRLDGLTSDGAGGLVGYLREKLSWVHQQRCVWHLWRNLGRELAGQAGETADLVGEAAKKAGDKARGELVKLIHGVLDAESYAQAEACLAKLKLHPGGARIWKLLHKQLDAALMHLLDCHADLIRVTPEWCWRDFRLRLSHGRNHGSEGRLERAALVWATYHNFTPAQRRSERKRHYRHPGQSPLEVVGHPPGEISYLDALGV